jgi:hypothetical protein
MLRIVGVEDKMKARLTELLSGLQANLQNFQLLVIQLPSKFSQTIQDIEKYKQDLTSIQFKLQEAQQFAKGMIEQARKQKDTITQEATSAKKVLDEVLEGSLDWVGRSFEEGSG